MSDKWFDKACNLDAQLQLQTARAEALLVENDRLREALKNALPHLEENARYLRDMQAHAGKVVDAFKAVDVVKAALVKEVGK